MVAIVPETVLAALSLKLALAVASATTGTVVLAPREPSPVTLTA